MLPKKIIILTLSLFVFIGCDSKDKTNKQTVKVDINTFEKWAKDFVAHPHNNIILTDAQKWFGEHFEADVASKLATEYQLQAKSGDLASYVKAQKLQGKTEVHVRSASKAIDLSANGLQNAALQRMKKPTTLFVIEMLRPGQKKGTTLWSFVHTPSGFKFIGKLTSLNPTKGDLATDLLCQMPLGKFGELLKQKGLIKGSAVDYLKEKGVLR